MDDVRAVMDAVGSKQAALFGICEGATMSALFAATHPQRTRALVMYGTRCPLLISHLTTSARALERTEQAWGQGIELPRFAPSREALELVAA